MMKSRPLCTLVIAMAVAAGSAEAAQEQKLLELINVYRSQAQLCKGSTRDAATPLAPAAELARLPLVRGQQLNKALREAGYHAARAEALTLVGPANADAAMRFLTQNSCQVLLDPRYSVAGVARSGREWQIVLAQPLLDPNLADWQTAGTHILQIVNRARSKPRNCGAQRFEAAPALAWSPRLGAAALGHSRDMAQRDVLSHEGRDSSTAGARATAAGYAWRVIGENVATGQGSPEQAVEGWLASAGHCANIMNRSFSEMGAAYAINQESDTIIFWTQVFGTPR
jgi:uncharacterized protein YkwD